MNKLSSTASASATVANQPAFDQGGFPVKVLKVIAGESMAWETLADTVSIKANVQPGEAARLAVHLHIANHVPELEHDSSLHQLTSNPNEHTAGRLVIELLKHFEPALLKKGIKGLSLEIEVTKGISIRGTGLGSSGATPAAALKAMVNILSELGVDVGSLTSVQLARLLHHADRGVPDNAIPAFFGGLNLISFDQENVVTSVRKISTPKNFLFILCTPTSFGISTQKAREALKGLSSPTENKQLSEQAIGFLQTNNIADYAKRIESLHEWFVSPRTRLYPEGGKVYDDAAVAAKSAGALGVTISGAGPTMIAFVPNELAGARVGQAMFDAFEQLGHSSTARLCTIDDL